VLRSYPPAFPALPITGVTHTSGQHGLFSSRVHGYGNGTIQLNYHDDADLTVDANNIPLNGSAAGAVTVPGSLYTVSKSIATDHCVVLEQRQPDLRLIYHFHPLRSMLPQAHRPARECDVYDWQARSRGAATALGRVQSSQTSTLSKVAAACRELRYMDLSGESE